MLKKLTAVLIPVLAIVAAIVTLAVAALAFDYSKFCRAMSTPAVAIVLYPPGVPTNGPANALAGRIQITTEGDVTIFREMPSKQEWRQKGGTYRVEPLPPKFLEMQKRIDAGEAPPVDFPSAE